VCSDCSFEIYEAALELNPGGIFVQQPSLVFSFLRSSVKCFELLDEDMCLSLTETDVKGSGTVGLVLLRESDIL
jgi:hypothetical protein